MSKNYNSDPNTYHSNGEFAAHEEIDKWKSRKLKIDPFCQRDKGNSREKEISILQMDLLKTM
jgi:hypothetical protein